MQCELRIRMPPCKLALWLFTLLTDSPEGLENDVDDVKMCRRGEKLACSAVKQFWSTYQMFFS